jgi:hypothetical protein
MNRFWLSTVAVGLLGAAGTVRADVVSCIESTAALYSAFADIDEDTTGTVQFRLRSGTYTITNELALDYRGNDGDGDPNRAHGAMTMSGGWNSGCTAQTATPGATTLVAPSGNGSVDIELNNNPFEVSSITSQNVIWKLGNWLCYTHHFSEGNWITVRQMRMENTRVIVNFACHSFAIRQSLITSRADNPDDNAIVYFSTGEGNDIPPLNFTMVGSTVRNGSLRVAMDNPDNSKQILAKLQNNIFDNDTVEVSMQGADLYAIRNRYDSIAVDAGLILQNQSNLSAPPQLGSNHVPNNASPVVNTASRFVDGGLPAIDLANNPREVGVRPDMGAFETAVNDSAVLTVTNTNSSGSGSLAAALASANAVNGQQTIEFDIAGGCPRVITLSSALNVTDELNIRGNTQSGTVFNTLDFGAYNGAPCIVLAAGAGVNDAINFDSAEAGDNLEVLNVGFSGFSNGVSIRSGAGHRLAGLQFGSVINATALADVNFPIRLFEEATDVEIGGSDLRSVNLIGSSSVGIQLGGLGGHLVRGNAIGSRGLDDLGNVVGMIVTSPSNRIEDNRIVLSASPNVIINGADARFNVIQNNTIAAGDSHGVIFNNGAANNRVGPENLITSNDGTGVVVVTGNANQVRENRISSSGELGIDLGNDGVTPNDDDPNVTTPGSIGNRGQNYPVLDTVRRIQTATNTFASLIGSLRTTPGSYAIDVFRVPTCDGSGFGEGTSLMGSATLEVGCSILNNGQCLEPLNILLPEPDFGETDAIALTATSSGGNTSEFSACYRQNPDFAISVTNNEDTVVAGRSTTYSIVARNAGFSPVGGERVRNDFPAACSSVSWVCSGTAGGTCTASGSGNINDGSINLPVGARITYTAVCQVSSSATGSISNTATISSSRADLSPSNNTATDADPIVATELSVNNISVTEGTGGSTQLTFTVIANPTPASPVSVNFATSNGTAIAGSDYTARSETLSFAAGQSLRFVSIPINPDAIVEGNETLTLTLSAPSNARIGNNDAIGTITNDDSATISIDDVSVIEGDSGTATLNFSARLSNLVQGIVTLKATTFDGNNINPSFNATAASGDYVALNDFNVILSNLTLARTVSVTVNGDATLEQDEQLRLRLTDLVVQNTIPNGAVTFADTIGIGTILNDDGQVTTTTILSDDPDPSAIGQGYEVVLRVVGAVATPAGTVTVSDGSASCTLTLAPSLPANTARGQCTLTSTSAGQKTLTATYVPSSNQFNASSDTEPHRVIDPDLIFEDGFE